MEHRHPKSREEIRTKRVGLRPPLGSSCRAGSYHTVGTRPDPVTRLSLVTRGTSRSLGPGNAALPMRFDSITVSPRPERSANSILSTAVALRHQVRRAELTCLTQREPYGHAEVVIENSSDLEVTSEAFDVLPERRQLDIAAALERR